MDAVRKVIAYKKYFLNFYQAQTEEVQRKIEWTLNLLQTIDRVPKKYFDHMTGTNGLFEVRVEFGGNIFRIFAFFDKGNLVILGNGFQKKSQKTPKTEIDKALKIKAEYENERK
ncbi:type II toxin-antitoxin system RelE/ParE family toxin [Pedobacter endophyticus]|uniref:Type II toxin-antitoxin system RelE/ParE family toxin n=1 Tax=Pedobacter endophyticus TaxID=2789740 RepID=A0A7U3Q3X0_9SPHI|nr:type II toxin-antitoxin system RelE/ParE family toxin [Pedobacter endophyticus]